MKEHNGHNHDVIKKMVGSVNKIVLLEELSHNGDQIRKNTTQGKIDD